MITNLDIVGIEAEVDAEYQRLGEAYEIETPNDSDNLLALAHINVVRRHMQGNMLAELAAGESGSGYSQQLSKISDDVRKIEKALGIDVDTRRKFHEQRRADEVIFDLLERTKEFRKKHMRHVQHCGILIAAIYVHFPAHVPRSITIKCPRCGVVFDAEIVTDEDLETYVEARDFMPAGVSPDVLEQHDPLNQA